MKLVRSSGACLLFHGSPGASLLRSFHYEVFVLKDMGLTPSTPS